MVAECCVLSDRYWHDFEVVQRPTVERKESIRWCRLWDLTHVLATVLSVCKLLCLYVVSDIPRAGG